MSFSSLIFSAGNAVYNLGPTLALATVYSAFMSKNLASATTRITLPAPVDAGKFTFAAVAALGVYKAFVREFNLNSTDTGAGNYITKANIGLSLAFVTNWALNPEQTVNSFAKFGGVAAFSYFCMNSLMNSVEPRLGRSAAAKEGYEAAPHNMELDRELLNVVRGGLSNLHKIALAGGVAWLVGSRLNFDTQEFTIFTVAGSALFYMTRSVFTRFENGDKSWMTYVNRAVALLPLSKVTSDYLGLDFPLYKPFLKAAAVAGGIIGGLEFAFEKLPDLFKEDEKGSNGGGSSSSGSGGFRGGISSGSGKTW